MAKIEELIETVKSMTVLELNDFVKALQEEFGVSAMAMAAPAAGAAEAAPEAEEEKTSFDVTLAAVGDKKIQVIKVVRQLTSLGLKEAKQLVDSAPKALKESCTKEEAEKMKADLEAEGATVEIK